MVSFSILIRNPQILTSGDPAALSPEGVLAASRDESTPHTFSASTMRDE